MGDQVVLAPYRKRNIILASDIRVVGPEDVPASWDTSITIGGLTYPTPYEAIKNAGGGWRAKINGSDALFTDRWYFELGIINGTINSDFLYFYNKNGTGSFVRFFNSNGQPQVGGTAFRVTDWDPWNDGDILMFAFDLQTRFFWTGKNGVWDGGADPATLTNPTGQFPVWDGITFQYQMNGGNHLKIYSGQEPMNYDVPFGFCPGWYQDN